MESNNENIETNSRVYELGYLLVPTLSLENMPISYGNLKDLIISLGGEIISDEIPKTINLAYTIAKVTQNVRNKFDMAYFGWVKFEINPEKVLELKKKLNIDPNFIRFLILKTVRENTIAAKRFIHKDSRRKMPTVKKEGENETSLPIDKEEIDKEIDAMVAV
ncbi:MAG: 30S ribosomal protein S6 [Candidatus Paceibacterota bacterium]|jgi:ribosomal protein S6